VPPDLKRPLLAIVGPTGSGKSSLALRAAGTFRGEIVNCDSLQLYRGFNIGTAKLPETERQAIPHHLFDVLEPGQSYSAGEYARRARQVIEEISGRGNLPVVAGGTGFYLRALLEGLPRLPERDTALRARLAAREEKRPGALHRLLRRLDPTAAARIHVRDVQKLTRALEVRLLTREALPPAASAEPFKGYRAVTIGLCPDRVRLNESLDERVREMFRSGLVEEVKQLLAQGCSGSEKPFESIGYKQALQHLRGSLTVEQAIASTQLETRQYAKRQLTWFRRDSAVKWLSGFGNDPLIIQQCLDHVATLISCGDGS
jgi:tRNA dimethylallyltransferase